MKRIATMLLLAGFGGGCMHSDAKKEPAGGFGTVSRARQVPGVQGPGGEPVMTTAASARGATPGGGVVQAGGVMPADGSKVQQAGHHKAAGDCADCAHVPGGYG